MGPFLIDEIKQNWISHQFFLPASVSRWDQPIELKKRRLHPSATHAARYSYCFFALDVAFVQTPLKLCAPRFVEPNTKGNANTFCEISRFFASLLPLCNVGLGQQLPAYACSCGITIFCVEDDEERQQRRTGQRATKNERKTVIHRKQRSEWILENGLRCERCLHTWPVFRHGLHLTRIRQQQCRSHHICFCTIISPPARTHIKCKTDEREWFRCLSGNGKKRMKNGTQIVRRGHLHGK